MAGLERRTLTAFSISVGINIILNIALIPRFGGVGAATATLASTTIWNILCWYFVKSQLGLDSTFISGVPTFLRRLQIGKGH